jgi:hypothetical protein
MKRMRMLLATGLAALLFAPMVAGADEFGGDRYGGAKVEEDAADPTLKNDTTTAPVPSDTTTTTSPSDIDRMGGEDTDVDVDVNAPPAPEMEADKADVDVNVNLPDQDRSVTLQNEAPVVATDTRTSSRGWWPGMALMVGGGVTDFVEDSVRGLTDIGGSYEARVAIGARRSLLGIEMAYVGTANDIGALGLDEDAFLISNSAEGALRLNLGTFAIQPFVFAGLSYIRYEIVNDSFNTSSIADDDNTWAVPLGAGISTYVGKSGFMLDGRFTYRPVFDEDMVTIGNDEGDLDNWAASLRLGYHF